MHYWYSNQERFCNKHWTFVHHDQKQLTLHETQRLWDYIISKNLSVEIRYYRYTAQSCRPDQQAAIPPLQTPFDSLDHVLFLFTFAILFEDVCCKARYRHKISLLFPVNIYLCFCSKWIYILAYIFRDASYFYIIFYCRPIGFSCFVSGNVKCL